jgi:hypothetical protein
MAPKLHETPEKRIQEIFFNTLIRHFGFHYVYYPMQEVERAARLLLLEKVVKGSLLGVLLLPLITCLSDHRLQESITTVLSVHSLKSFPDFLVYDSAARFLNSIS